MIEPEVLLDGSHTIERCEEVTEAALRAAYAALADSALGAHAGAERAVHAHLEGLRPRLQQTLRREHVRHL